MKLKRLSFSWKTFIIYVEKIEVIPTVNIPVFDIPSLALSPQAALKFFQFRSDKFIKHTKH
jgi:hypothetical protein